MEAHRMKGEKIYLRALEPADVEALYHWENDTEVWRFGNTNIPFSRHQLRQYILSTRDIFSDKQLRLMICLNLSAKPVGCIDLFDFDPKHSRAGVGILIESKERRRGYASEALNILIKYAFQTLCLHQLYCSIPEQNKASEKLFVKNGFKKTAVRSQWIRTDTGWLDEHIYQLINPGNK